MGAPAKSPCDACDARCCSAYAVHVTGDDVWRIADGVGLPAHAFLVYAPQAVRTGTGFLLAPGGPPHDLLLAQARGAPAGARAPCTFLRAGDGGAPRCGIYPCRPIACRRFPAARLDGGYGVRDGIVCGPDAWAAHDMARLGWRVALAREEREVEAYAAVVAIWNARVEGASPHAPTTVLEYLGYLEDAYRWLVRFRAALRPAQRRGEAFLGRVRETIGACPPR
jgi:Fe-S-cluster containining protein